MNITPEELSRLKDADLKRLITEPHLTKGIEFKVDALSSHISDLWDALLADRRTLERYRGALDIIARNGSLEENALLMQKMARKALSKED